MSDLFRDILGHDRVKAGLIHAAAADRVHHAWLFAGRAGVGKGLVAKRFAQLLMCERCEPGAGEEALAICMSCRHCMRLEEEQHPDFERITAEGRGIKIKQVRELQKKVTFRPFEARYRVVLIEGAEILLDAAANALLKTLEEPTDRTIFLLLSDQLHRVMTTIVSRCQVIRFSGFTLEAIRSALRERGASDDEDRIRLASVLAQGSIGRALTLLEDEEALDGQLAVLRDALALPERGVGAALSLADAVSSDKSSLPLLLGLLRAWFRDMMLVKAGAQRAEIGFDWRRDELATRSARLSSERIFGALDAIFEVERALDANVQPLLALESLFLSLSEAT